MSEGAVYEFGNGLRLNRADLMDLQVKRYTTEGNPNLHEPVEEDCMLRAFASEVPAEPVFLDIGAAVGYYSILIKMAWPAARVVAVDALPRHLQALRANVELNGLAVDSVELRQEALGIEDGEAEFADAGYGSALAGAISPSRRPHLPLFRVPVRSLATLLADLGPVHLMKMDIQGSELEVLGAARQVLASGGVRHALIGTHGHALHIGVRDLLQDCGFRIELDDPAPPMQPDGIVLARYP